jgi:hypothetical protein
MYQKIIEKQYILYDSITDFNYWAQLYLRLAKSPVPNQKRSCIAKVRI